MITSATRQRGAPQSNGNRFNALASATARYGMDPSFASQAMPKSGKRKSRVRSSAAPVVQLATMSRGAPLGQSASQLAVGAFGNVSTTPTADMLTFATSRRSPVVMPILNGDQSRGMSSSYRQMVTPATTPSANSASRRSPIIPLSPGIPAETANDDLAPGSVFIRRGEFSSPSPVSQITAPPSQSSNVLQRPINPNTDISHQAETPSYGEDEAEGDNMDTSAGQDAQSLDDDIVDGDVDLIEWVRAYRSLWDHRHKEHSNRPQTEKNWRAIGKELGRNWLVCKGRWQNIRRTYARIRRKLPPSGSAYEEARDEKVVWPLYAHVEFIDGSVMAQRRTYDNMEPVRRGSDSVNSVNDSASVQQAKRRRSTPVSVEDICTTIQQTSNGLLAAMAGPSQSSAIVPDSCAALGKSMASFVLVTLGTFHSSFQAHTLPRPWNRVAYVLVGRTK